MTSVYEDHHYRSPQDNNQAETHQNREALYHTYLEGLGYKPLEWRETPSTKTTFYELNYKTYGQQVKPLQMTDQAQATRLTRAARAQAGNKDVKLTKVELITTEMRID